ncbi:aldehyde ferredoxin oxidoreductase family protein [Chloroflexota bacterium]
MAENILPGYAGKLLRSNLTTKKMTYEDLEEGICREYLGGAALGAKILYDEVPPDIDWSNPENRVILTTGPLGGTRFGGTGTFSLATKGAMTNGATSTQANGFLGAYLKFCGFDGIIIQGAADKWVYLYVHDGVAELRDASHLLGKDTWETEDSIKQELGVEDKAMSVFCIGPAGENLVRFAVVAGDKGHVAAHNGPGAVMGSKKLKAIAVARGRGRVEVKNPEALAAVAKKALETAKEAVGGQVYNYGTTGVVLWANMQSWLPVKNYTTNIWDIDEKKLERFGAESIRANFKPKPHPCWACQFHHINMLTIPDGTYKGEVVEEPDMECYAAWGPLIGNDDINTTMILASDVDRLGVDNNEAGWVVSLAMECYEKGILNKEKTDGLELTWGNTEAARSLLQKVSRREGIGDLFADGVKKAAERLGGEALNIAIYTQKGNTPRTHDHRTLWFEMFDVCTSDAGTIQSRHSMVLESIGITGEGVVVDDPFSGEAIATLVAKTRGSMQFEDSIGVCSFITNMDLRLLTEALQAVTGWDINVERAMEIGRKAVNTMRVFNLRCGISPKLEVPSPRYGSTPVDGLSKGISIMPHWDQMLQLYYELMGWDKQTGKPLPETLKELGLEQAIPQIWGE